MSNVKFDHSQAQIHRSIGISDDRADQLTATILFEIINQSYLVDKLFNDPSEAPENLRTKTGIMEKVFEDTSNPNELIYATWEFAKFEAMQKHDNTSHKMNAALTMLFMMSDMKKEKFIKNYIERKKQAESED